MTYEKMSIQDRRDRLVAVLRFCYSQSGFSQRALAKAIGISKSQVGHVLTTQRRLEFVELVDWLIALDIEYLEFIEMLDNPPASED